MLSFVPVTFDLYRPLKPRLRWVMQCLVSFADHAGRCFPSVRRFAVHAGISKSAAQRDLAELVDLGLATCKRRPGRGYVYRVARRFLPKLAPRKLSQDRDRKSEALHQRQQDRSFWTVPQPGTKEKPRKNNQEYARSRASFSKPGMTSGSLPDQTDQYRQRIRFVDHEQRQVLARRMGTQAE